MNILIAEDEEFSRHVLTGQLEQLGHKVVAVADGNEAWDRLQREEFQLVITDWMMPGLDGLALVRLIRARENSNYVYAILLTAKSEQCDVIEGIMQGADDFLTKPHDQAELDVRIRAGERVIELERRLSAQNRELADANAKIERASRRMKNDLNAAARIQRSLLPTKTPKSDAVDFAWIYEPCHELAGDIFNVFELDCENIAFYLLDVVGKGVPAALLSVTLSRFLSPLSGSSLLESSRSGDGLTSPSELATELNKRFPMDADNEQNFTLLYGYYNIQTRKMRYVCAGHPGPLYVPGNGKPKILDGVGFPVGMFPDPGYVDEVFELGPGDSIVLYSDGLLDAENPDGAYFGKEGLLASFGAQCDSLDEGIRSLHHQVRRFCDGQSQTDDISVLAMRALPEG